MIRIQIRFGGLAIPEAIHSFISPVESVEERANNLPDYIEDENCGEIHQLACTTCEYLRYYKIHSLLPCLKNNIVNDILLLSRCYSI